MRLGGGGGFGVVMISGLVGEGGVGECRVPGVAFRHVDCRFRTRDVDKTEGGWGLAVCRSTRCLSLLTRYS